MKCEGVAGLCRCSGKDTEFEVIITYGLNFYGKPDSDLLYLCGDCAERLKKDAENHEYEVLKRKVEK